MCERIEPNMKLRLLILLLLGLNIFTIARANEPQKVYLFAYGENGLRFAYSTDQINWHAVGDGYPFLKSDFGRWGSQKKMYNPFLFKGADNVWRCVWTLNDDVNAFAYTSSENLTQWTVQSYPYVTSGNNCENLSVSLSDGIYTISWESTKESHKGCYAITTTDFEHYTDAKSIAKSDLKQRVVANVMGKEEQGTVHEVKWSEVDCLIKAYQLSEYKKVVNSETFMDDQTRFAKLKPFSATIKADTAQTKKISDSLIGIFFEDINYSADGGLYAELVRNRDFEFSNKDRKEWNAKTAWKKNNEDELDFNIETKSPIHKNNKHYAVLDVKQIGGAIINEGYNGIALKAGDKYNVSFFAKNIQGKGKKMHINLLNDKGESCGEFLSKVVSSSEWKRYHGVITAKKSAANAQLEIAPQTTGIVALDMVSLFPEKTFKGRENGLRADLAQTLADMKPRFVRFPGGCVAHGDGVDNIYHWKNTIGSLESRKQDRNLWGYHQSMGLGYFEYFQFCEDVGAEPLPVLAAGVPCQNSGAGGYGQQCGIPMNKMKDYIQDIFDLIEWANGNPKTNKWAKMRADAGHPKPFNLKYLGIGNEDLISDVFKERFEMIYKAVHEKYPNIIIIGTVGPFSEGADYKAGWDFATKLEVPMVDEHYYQPPGWFLHNQDYYDKYDRSKSKVYLGEYAAHVTGRKNNIETALLEALHLTNIERNADVVTMTSYAPLLAKEGFTQWNPDLIYFNNTEVKPGVGYYTQKLFGQNSGDEYVGSVIKLSDDNVQLTKRIGKSIVRDSKTGDIIVKLVNLLPVDVSTRLDLSNLKIPDTNLVATVLSGAPDDTNAKPKMVNVNTGNLILEPYSLTVIRIKQ